MMRTRMAAVLAELRHHAPFTLFGAATGILCMLLFRSVGPHVSLRLFQVFHPGHVVLSAMVTASLFKLYDSKRGFLTILLIGYFGAIGVATLSDCVLPFLGERILGVALPSHQDAHGHDEAHEDDGEAAHEAPAAAQAEVSPSHATEPSIHLGFIEEWYLVNPAALLGVIIAYFRPRTKFPHAGHVLISTWASSFHVLMNTHTAYTPVMLLGMFIVLFVAVWLPCCVSDIVFPLLFVRSGHLPVGHHHGAEVPS